MASTGRYTNVHSGASSRPVPTMLATGPRMIGSSSSWATPAPQMSGVPKSSWIAASNPMATQRFSTKQPYMMLAGNNNGNNLSQQIGQNSVKFSAAVPPSNWGPSNSLQGPAQVARGKTVMNAASLAMPNEGEGYDFAKDMANLKEQTMQRIEDKVNEMRESIKQEEAEFTVENKMEARSTDLGSFLDNRPQATSVVEGKWDDKGQPPNNLYKPKEPYKGKVIFNTTLTGPDAGEVCHIVFDHDGKIPYAEGQSIGIVAPGEDEKGKPHKLRLYSIASSAPGDYGDAKTVSLCVKRVVYNDEDGKEVRGVCSNHLCDLKEGDEVAITGPVGKALLLPDDPKANVIMLATGTGIAPFRSFLWRYFMEKHDDFQFDGNAWLFLGVPTTSALLYDDEFKKMKELGGDKFRYDYAISREAKDEETGAPMYIQNKMKQYGQELWDLMQKDNTYVYMCGLKGMESGIQEALGSYAEKNGVEWKDFVAKLKKDGRYHVEVY